MKPLYRLERTHNSVATLRFDGVKSGWEAWFLLCSDRHWDHPCSDREMQKRHLDEAKERNAGIMEAGDLFCAMQGRDDKRGNKSSIRAEHHKDAYFDELSKDAVGWFKPYARQFVFISPGNHETAVLKRHEVDLTDRMVTGLRAHGSDCLRLTYAGWVRFLFNANGTKSFPVRMFYHHGWGGGGPVTRGVIDTNRMAVYQDAELVWTGHTHDSWQVPIARQRLSHEGFPILDEQLHFRTPGYKDEFSPMQGFHIEKGRGPKPIGAAWLHFWWKNDAIHYEVERAR